MTSSVGGVCPFLEKGSVLKEKNLGGKFFLFQKSVQESKQEVTKITCLVENV